MPKFSAYMKGGDGSVGPPGASIINGVLANEGMLPVPNQGKYAFLVGTSDPKHFWVWNDQKEGENKWEDQGTTASEIGGVTASASTVAWNVPPSITTQFSTSNQVDYLNFDFDIPMGRPAGFGTATATISSTNWDANPTISTSISGDDWAKNLYYDFTIPVGRPAGFGEINATAQSVSSNISPSVSISTDEESPEWAKNFDFNFSIPKGTPAGFGTQHVSVSTLRPGEDAVVEITTVTSSPETAKEFNFHFGLPQGDALAIYESVPFTTQDGSNYYWDTTNTTTLIFDRGTMEKIPIYIYNSNNESLAATFKLSASTIEYEVDEKFDGIIYFATPATLQNIQIGKVSSTTYDYEPVVSKSTGSTSTNLILDFVIPKGEKGEKGNEIYSISTGSITSFTATDAPVGDLKVDIEPVQDLHGYDNPWPAGGGANLLPKATSANVNTPGVTTTIAEDGTITLNGTATATGHINVPFTTPLPIGNYSFSFFNNKAQNDSENRAELSLRKNNDNVISESWYTSTELNRTKSFALSEVAYSWRIQFNTGEVFSNFTCKPMLVLGSTPATSYAPYSNICPITGWTGMNVQRTGKNLCEGSTNHLIGLFDTNTVRVDNGTGTCLVAHLIKGETYTFSNTDINRYLVTYWDSIPAVNSGATSTKFQNTSPNTTFTAKYSGLALIYIYNSAVDTSNAQIELGSTATSYESYLGTTYPISWSTEAGTVYGGSLDVTTGVLTVDRASVDLGTLTWNLHSQSFMVTAGGINNIKSPSSSSILIDNALCSTLKVVKAKEIYDGDYGIGVHYTGEVRIRYANMSTNPTTFKSNVTGWTFIYPLAEPITYQLTPTEVTTLLGVNNAWADTGDSNLIYFKNSDDGTSAGVILSNINSNIDKKSNIEHIHDDRYYTESEIDTKLAPLYGYCTTAAGTVAKTVSIPNFKLETGVTIFVKFQNANSASNPTLNVNSTGAKRIYRYGTTAASTTSGTNGWQAGAVLALTYDGTGWIEHYWYNNTYTLANNCIGSGHFTANSAVYRYQLLVHTDREHLSPFNNDNNITTTTKTILTNIEFDPFEPIYCYDSTTNVSADSLISGSSLYYTKENMDLRIVFNIDDDTSPLTLHKDVYMKVTPLSNGKVKLASAMPLVQQLPSTNDGYWYIFLGRATTRTYGLTLYPDKPVFYHDGTRIRQKFNPYIEKDFRCYHVTATIPQGTTKSFTVTGCTPTMRVINCVFGTPSNITSNVQWTTTTDLVKFDGTFTGNTDVEFDLIESDTLTAVGI